MISELFETVNLCRGRTFSPNKLIVCECSPSNSCFFIGTFAYIYIPYLLFWYDDNAYLLIITLLCVLSVAKPNYAMTKIWILLEFLIAYLDFSLWIQHIFESSGANFIWVFCSVLMTGFYAYKIVTGGNHIPAKADWEGWRFLSNTIRTGLGSYIPKCFYWMFIDFYLYCIANYYTNWLFIKQKMISSLTWKEAFYCSFFPSFSYISNGPFFSLNQKFPDFPRRFLVWFTHQ